MNKFGIIIEGVECAGKTTLIQRIRSEVLPWDCKMLAHVEGKQFDRFIYEYMFTHNIIFNRSHISEVVYSRLWNRASPFTKSEREVLDDYINRNYILILGTADEDKLVERYNSRNYKQKITANQINKIKSLFEDECKNCKHIIYNGSDMVGIDTIIATLKNIVKK